MYITPRQISRQYDVSLSFAYRQIRNNKLKSYRVGRLVRIKAEDFEQFLRDCQTKASDSLEAMTAKATGSLANASKQASPSSAPPVLDCSLPGAKLNVEVGVADGNDVVENAPVAEKMTTSAGTF